MTEQAWTGPRGPSYCCCQGDSQVLALGLQACSVSLSGSDSFTFSSTVVDAGWSSAAWLGLEAPPDTGEGHDELREELR